MRFVHLAPRSAISRIRRHGLRLGNGEWGRGLYAVPLMLLEQDLITWDEEMMPASVERTLPLSSSLLWKWYVGRARHNGKAIAVVFDLPQSHWPVDLCIMVRNAHALVSWIDSTGHGHVDADIRDFLEGREGGGFSIQVDTPRSLGLLLHEYLRLGNRPWASRDSRRSEDLETLIHFPVKPRHIQKLVPMYRTNPEFREKRLDSLCDDELEASDE